MFHILKGATLRVREDFKTSYRKIDYMVNTKVFLFWTVEIAASHSIVLLPFISQ